MALGKGMYNFILALCLIIILILIYLKTKTLDLFGDTTPSNTSNINLLTNNDYLSTFISKYIKNIQQKNSYMKKLEQQQKTIATLSQQVSNLINPST
jgi:cell division protein FtsL